MPSSHFLTSISEERKSASTNRKNQKRPNFCLIKKKRIKKRFFKAMRKASNAPTRVHMEMIDRSTCWPFTRPYGIDWRRDGMTRKGREKVMSAVNVERLHLIITLKQTNSFQSFGTKTSANESSALLGREKLLKYRFQFWKIIF